LSAVRQTPKLVLAPAPKWECSPLLKVSMEGVYFWNNTWRCKCCIKQPGICWSFYTTVKYIKHDRGELGSILVRIWVTSVTNIPLWFPRKRKIHKGVPKNTRESKRLGTTNLRQEGWDLPRSTREIYLQRKKDKMPLQLPPTIKLTGIKKIFFLNVSKITNSTDT
jgi:hypothetical protein